MSDLFEYDFYPQLIQLIESKQTQEALDLFETCDTKREQLQTLAKISRDLANILNAIHDNVSTSISAFEHYRTFALALASAFELIHDLNREIARASDLIRNAPRDRDLARDRYGDVVGSLTLKHNRVFDLARNLADVLISNLKHAHERSVASDLARARALIKFIFAVPIMQNKPT